VLGATGGLTARAIGHVVSMLCRPPRDCFSWLAIRQFPSMVARRKQIQHFHEPGDCHELTFSCYRRLPLLTNDLWRRMFCEAIERALQRHAFRLAAFVLMPEHVHLLVYPTSATVNMDELLYAIKRPFSYRIKQLLSRSGSPLLDRLTVQERPGKTVFRFWQEGPGYDRNLSTEQIVLNVVDYIHANPVRRGLVAQARDWKWSSIRWYEAEGATSDPDLPTIHGLPGDFFRQNGP
jgi:putative transposase